MRLSTVLRKKMENGEISDGKIARLDVTCHKWFSTATEASKAYFCGSSTTNRMARTLFNNAIWMLLASSSTSSVDLRVIDTPCKSPSSSAADAMWLCFPSLLPPPWYAQLLSPARIVIRSAMAGNPWWITDDINCAWLENVTIATMMPWSIAKGIKSLKKGLIFTASSSLRPRQWPAVWMEIRVMSKSCIRLIAYDQRGEFLNIICRYDRQ